MAFKFIHMADVHLDTPFQSRDEDLRKMLKDSIKQALKSSVDLALSERVHAVLIAGDLFDSETLSFSSEKFLIHEVQRLREAGIEVFYASGNHDPTNSISRHRTNIWPDNVHVFGTHNVESIPVFDSEGNKVGIVTGAGHESKMEGRNLASYFPQAGEGIPHVGLLHAFVTSSKSCESHGRYAPCSLPDLKDKGYSYWALGHIHAREEIYDNPPIVYPGNLMGRNPGETGHKGVYLVEIKPSGSTAIKFIPLSPIVWKNVTVEGLSLVSSLHELESTLCSEILKAMEQENNEGCRMMLRVILQGPCPVYNELSDENIRVINESIMSDLNINYLEIISDAVTRPIEPDMYKDQPHVLSSVLTLIDRLKEDDEFLLKLSQGDLAGIKMGAERKERIEYLRSLLEDLDYEGASRLLKEGTL